MERLKAHTKCRKIYISELQYTNDYALLAAFPQALQYMLDVLNHAYSALGLKVNAEKTKILEMGNSNFQYSINNKTS